MTDELSPGTPSPFEQIRRVNDAGNPHGSSRDFARILNGDRRVDDHFIEITEMIEVGKADKRLVHPREARTRYQDWGI